MVYYQGLAGNGTRNTLRHAVHESPSEGISSPDRAVGDRRRRCVGPVGNTRPLRGVQKGVTQAIQRRRPHPGPKGAASPGIEANTRTPRQLHAVATSKKVLRDVVANERRGRRAARCDLTDGSGDTLPIDTKRTAQS